MKANTKSNLNEKNMWDGRRKRIETQVVPGLVISELPHAHIYDVGDGLPRKNGLKLGHITPYMETRSHHTLYGN